MLTDVEVFAIRAVGLPAHLREKLYPELSPSNEMRTCCNQTWESCHKGGGCQFRAWLATRAGDAS
ncbi:hypothetical protein [Burkholderia cepacia]|uniref:hypothetical protein n=1 Tax=Burkholderia cepacia TaxID=292 RepID=UPI00075B4997|nr:hypothetical protein [Burkholderia cepacia]